VSSNVGRECGEVLEAGGGAEGERAVSIDLDWCGGWGLEEGPQSLELWRRWSKDVWLEGKSNLGRPLELAVRVTC